MSAPTHCICSSCGTKLPIEKVVELPLREGSQTEYPALQFETVGDHRCLVWRHDQDTHERVVETVGPSHVQVPGCVVDGVVHAWHAPDSHYNGTWKRRVPTNVYANAGDRCIRCGAIAGLETFELGDRRHERNFWTRPRGEDR